MEAGTPRSRVKVGNWNPHPNLKMQEVVPVSKSKAQATQRNPVQYDQASVLPQYLQCPYRK